MRYWLFILLSIALPAHAGLEEMVKDAIKSELERRIPQPKPQLVFDLPEKSTARYNLHWRLSGRVGPFTYRDDRLEDHYWGRLGFRPQGGIKGLRPENWSKVYIEIRKDF